MATEFPQYIVRDGGWLMKWRVSEYNSYSCYENFAKFDRVAEANEIMEKLNG